MNELTGMRSGKPLTNADRRARADAEIAKRKIPREQLTDYQRLVGEGCAAATGAEFARLQANENLRGQLNAALKNLTPVSDRSIFNANARKAYERLHEDCLRLALAYFTATGRETTVPGLRPDHFRESDIVVNEDWLK